MLDCRYVGGRREFFSTRDEAEAVREVKLTELRQHGAAAMTLAMDERAAFVCARERLTKIGMTLEQAVEFCERNHRKAKPMLFSEAIRQMIDTKRSANLDPVYVRKLESHLNNLMRVVGDRQISMVTQSEIESWLHRSAWKPATIRNLRIDVRTFFRFSQKRGWITENPAEHLERVKLPDTPPGILTVEECRAVLKSALQLKSVLPYVVLNLLCGLRPEECVEIGPERLRLDRGYVEVPAAVAKSRQRRIVQISANARKWLKRSPALSVRSPKWYARQLPKLRAEASSILGRPMPWPKNCLRHSFGSYHLAMHRSADQTAHEMGHRSTDMLFRHYRELVSPEDARAFWSIAP